MLHHRQLQPGVYFLTVVHLDIKRSTVTIIGVERVLDLFYSFYEALKDVYGTSRFSLPPVRSRWRLNQE